MSRATDKFNDDFAVIERNERQLNELLKERATKLKEGEPTGSVIIVAISCIDID